MIYKIIEDDSPGYIIDYSMGFDSNCNVNDDDDNDDNNDNGGYCDTMDGCALWTFDLNIIGTNGGISLSDDDDDNYLQVRIFGPYTEILGGVNDVVSW